MRKQIWLAVIAVVCLGIMSVGVAGAQDKKVALKLGEYTKGSITAKVYEVAYSFSGKKGDIITLEIMPDPEQPDLDPTVELRDSDGQVIATNDDFNYPLALAIGELPADGDYIAVAGRSGGESGESTGDYNLRVSVATLVEAGATIDAKVSSDYNAPPQIYVMRPAAATTLEISFSQEVGEYYAALRLLKWDPEGYPDTLVSVDNTSKLSKATLTVDLDADNFYVLKLEQASYSFSDPVDFPVTITLK